ncbi:hypothetical protein BCY84_05542 [Trypanosoma cruzi cruzi]|nr:hypothetical protein BCY84_05542 [Trypanosoma cruzi cruzi]
MSLSSLLVVASATHLRCTVLFVRPFTCSAPVFTSLLHVSAGTHNHMHTRCRLQWILMLLLWRVLAVAGGCCFLRGHEGKEGKEGARTASHSSCGCDARGGLRLLWSATSFRCALLRRCAVRWRMSFVMRVRAGHVFPGRWAAAICLWRLV